MEKSTADFNLLSLDEKMEEETSSESSDEEEVDESCGNSCGCCAELQRMLKISNPYETLMTLFRKKEGETSSESSDEEEVDESGVSETHSQTLKDPVRILELKVEALERKIKKAVKQRDEYKTRLGLKEEAYLILDDDIKQNRAQIMDLRAKGQKAVRSITAVAKVVALACYSLDCNQ